MFINHVLFVSTWKPLQKAAKISHVKINICKSFSNQSSASSPNAIRNSHLNACKQPSPTNICEPFLNVTKFSYLEALETALRKLHHDGSVNTAAVSSEKHLRFKSNHL